MKTCIVGGSRGIGLATAMRMARAEGARVAISGRDRGALQTAAGVLADEASDARIFTAAVDIADGAAVTRYITNAATELEGLDALIWVAAQSPDGSDPDAWTRNFDANVSNAIRALEAAVPHLADSHNGSAVFVITSAAIEYFRLAGSSAYAPVKAALMNMALSRAHTLGAQGIRVNTVSPAQTLSPGNTWDRLRERNDPLFREFVEQTALGRFVTADEVAHAIQFLTEATGVTGTNLVVDAGFTRSL